MNADEMFKKLGYLINEIYNEDKRYITYVKNEYLFIKFDTKNETFTTFLNDHYGTSFEIEMDELKAIDKKCEELGWYD